MKGKQKGTSVIEIPFGFGRLPGEMLVVKNEYDYHQ